MPRMVRGSENSGCDRTSARPPIFSSSRSAKLKSLSAESTKKRTSPACACGMVGKALADFGAHLRQREAGEAAVDGVGDLAELLFGNRLFEFDHDRPHRAGGQRDDDEHAAFGDTHEVDAVQHGFVERGDHGDGEQARGVGEHARRDGHDFVDLLRHPFKLALDGLALFA